MIRPLHFLHLFILLALSVGVASAQVTTGTPPFGSFGGGPDVINLANLNSHITIPVRSKPGRGMDFTYNLSYDSAIWYPVGASGSQNWQPATNWGWKGQTTTAIGYIGYGSTTTTRCLLDVYPRQYGTTIWYRNWYYVDEFGTPHGFGLFATYDSDCSGTSSGSAVATDGSGYTINATGNLSATITPRGGGVINAPLQSETGLGSKMDPNGNLISVSASSPQTFTDTLGTTALAISGSAPNPVSYTYKNAAGTSVSVTIYYQAYTVKTNFGISGINEYGPTIVSLIDHIALPNTKQYSFTYEQTPGTCTPLTGTYQGYCVTGRIASASLPTGGTISYTYTNGNLAQPAASNGIVAADGSTAGLQRTVSTGAGWTAIWKYDRAQVSGSHWTTTITDPTTPTANQTVIDFQGIYETQRKVYQGSSSGTLLQTVNTCYNGSAIPCVDATVTLPISRRTVVFQPDSGTLQSKTDTFFNSYGLPTEVDEYDFGSGSPPSSPTRKTLIAYANLGNGIVGQPASITICSGTGSSSSCGGTGTQVAQTTFGYDQTAVTTTSGVPQHSGVTGSRGNLTTVNRWISSTTYASATASYYDTGKVKVATDPGLHNTTFSYTDSWGDSFCAPPANSQAFPTQITNHLSQNRQVKYYQCTGQLYSARDPNDIANNRDGAKLTYNDSLGRPTQVDFADGGRTTIAYDDSQRTITTTKKQSDTINISETDQYDQLGRLTQRQLPGSRKIDTTYDVLGQVWKTSNPYLNITDSTYGLTETQYDPLGRVTKLIRQDDTSSAQIEYNSNEIRVTDEAGKKRLALTDGLGRLTKVCEVTAGNTRSPNESCGFNNFTENGYITANAYNILDNVTQIVQGTGTQQQTRTMAYDGLSRITSATIPEVSTSTGITYGYDLDSNAISVADPRNTMNFVYDALHRATQKRQGTTLIAQYSYDGTAANNAIGRLITETDGAVGSGADKSDYTYDPLGRIKTANRTVSGTPYDIAYLYDLMGSLTQLTYPSGRIVTYSYNSAAELNKVTDSTSTNFDYVTGASYSPLGTLQQLNLANNVATTLGWTKLARLSSILTQKSGSAALLDLGYSYYANGQIQQLANNLDGLKSEKYTYDALGRLLTAQRGPDNNIQRKYSYDYDRFGNRWDQHVDQGNGFNSPREFGFANNRITSTGFSYDASGNITANGPGTSFTYNPENFMLSATSTLGAPIYAVDIKGRRAKKTVSGTTTDYFYSGSVVISEKQGTTWTDYIFFGNQRIAKQTGGTSSTATYLHADHLGSTRSCTDSNGISNGSCDYEPFGEFQPGSGCSALPTNYKFAGMEFDSETGLYHTWFRKYDPNQGRWMSVDPLPGSPDDPQSLNRYVSVRDDWVNRTDPSGLCSLQITYRVHMFWLCWGTTCYIVGGYIEILSANIIGVCGERERERDRYDPKKDFRDYAVQLSNDPNMSDCEKMARLVFKAGQAFGTLDGISGLLTGLTERGPTLVGSSDPNYRVGVFRSDPYYASGFGDTGFLRQFRDQSNQVRHFVGYMALGYMAGNSATTKNELYRNEGTSDLQNPDVALGLAALNIGSEFGHGYGHDWARLAQDIWKNICGGTTPLKLQ